MFVLKRIEGQLSNRGGQLQGFVLNYVLETFMLMDFITLL